MLIKAASLREAPGLADVARTLREHGRNAIWVASELLDGSRREPSEAGHPASEG
jgi:hypothetical protein